MQVTDLLKEFDREIEGLEIANNREMSFYVTSDLEKIYEERRKIGKELKDNRSLLKDAIDDWLKKEKKEN